MSFLVEIANTVAAKTVADILTKETDRQTRLDPTAARREKSNAPKPVI